MRSIRVSAGIALLAAGVLVGGMATPAGAQIAHPRVVSANPADWTPKLPNLVTNTATHAFAQIGSTMYAGGQFTSVNGVARTNIVAFDATTGTLTSFRPNVNGAVWGLAAAPDGKLFVGGYFTSINGVPRRGVAKLDPVTGAVDPTFVSPLSGNVSDLKYACGRLFVGGWFSRKLLALNPTTGADTGYLNLGISGSVTSSSTATHVYRFAVSPTCTRLAAIGNFTTVSGQTRSRAFMVALGTTTGSLDAWYYQPLTRMCAASSLPVYLKGVDFSPDGSYFAIASTGFVPQSGDLFVTLCDATARFETAIATPDAADLDQLHRRRLPAQRRHHRRRGLRRRPPALARQPERTGQPGDRGGLPAGYRGAQPGDGQGAELEPDADAGSRGQGAVRDRRGAVGRLGHRVRRGARMQQPAGAEPRRLCRAAAGDASRHRVPAAVLRTGPPGSRGVPSAAGDGDEDTAGVGDRLAGAATPA